MRDDRGTNATRLDLQWRAVDLFVTGSGTIDFMNDRGTHSGTNSAHSVPGGFQQAARSTKTACVLASGNHTLCVQLAPNCRLWRNGNVDSHWMMNDLGGNVQWKDCDELAIVRCRRASFRDSTTVIAARGPSVSTMTVAFGSKWPAHRPLNKTHEQRLSPSIRSRVVR